jgi:hypothetical protein
MEGYIFFKLVIICHGYRLLVLLENLQGVAMKFMIFFQVYPHAFSLLRVVTFEVLPWSSYAFGPIILPPLETFLQVLLWNTFQCQRHFFPLGCFQYHEMFVSFRHTLILETARSYLEPDKGNRVGVPFQ